MPRVTLTKKTAKLDGFSKFIKVKMVENDVKQYQMAQLLQCDKSTFCRKLQNHNFTLDEIIVMFNFFKKISAEEIKDVFIY